MKKIIALVALALFFTACSFEMPERPAPVVPEFIPVAAITGIPTGSLPYLEINLSGTVMPANATHKRIEWSIKEDNGTSAILERNRLSTDGEGTVTVTALIKNGSAEGEDYTQDFTILISISTP